MKNKKFKLILLILIMLFVSACDSVSVPNSSDTNPDTNVTNPDTNINNSDTTNKVFDENDYCL